MVTLDLTAQADLHSGKRFEGYKLLQLVAHGGQSEVWSAWDTKKNRVVAIKILKGSQSEKDLLSVYEEMQISTALDHPQIVKIFEYKSSGNRPYFVMEYFAFGSLARAIARGPMTPEIVLWKTRFIIDALAYMHERFVVHRDLKPTNILIDTGGKPYLTDFGIAKTISQSTIAFHTGHGTAHYSAPEQHTRKAITIHSDIYSLGIILYEMFTGKLPWNGDAPLAMMQSAAQGAAANGEVDTDRAEIPDPKVLVPELPEKLVDALRKMTSFMAEDRPSSVSEVWSLLAAVFPAEAGDVSIDLRKSPERMRLEDGIAVFKRARTYWQKDKSRFDVPITDFAVSHSILRENAKSIDDDSYQFMLSGAFYYPFEMEFWWQVPVEKDLRLKTCERLIELENATVSDRVIKWMLENPDFLPDGGMFSDLTTDLLVNLIDTPLSESALNLLEKGQSSADEWSDDRFSAIAETRLSGKALSDADEAEIAIHVIADMKSTGAAAEIARYPDTKRAGELMTMIWQRAGSLPRGLPVPIWLRVILETIRQVFTTDPRGFLMNYLFAAMGSGLALGMTVFLGYRWVTLIDTTRVLNGLGSTFLFGPVIGFGIILARILPHRMNPLGKPTRIIIATISGMLFINLGFIAFHKIFLNTTLMGLIISFASLTMGAGYALGEGFLKGRSLRMFLSVIIAGAAVGGSWFLFLNGGTSPLLYFDGSEPLRTGLMIVMASLLMGVVPYLGKQFE